MVRSPMGSAGLAQPRASHGRGRGELTVAAFDRKEFSIISNHGIMISGREVRYDAAQNGSAQRSHLSDVAETCSEVMQEVLGKIQTIAPTRITVLLTGETGTGKSMLAQMIHQGSNRMRMPFTYVHCGAIPETLLESELFGHERGAFTGAIRRRTGKFESAQGGTIFLDEVGTISASMQVKLLQIVQEKTYQRVGGEETLEADVRIIAATNADLKKLCQESSFRSDLYYRLSPFPIHIPPLRDRKEDIPLLVSVFLKRLNALYSKNILEIHPMVLEAFQEYFWPGNIRELENLVERAYIIEISPALTPDSFPDEIFTTMKDSDPKILVNDDITLAEARRRSIENTEQNYLRDLLTRNRGMINRTAKAAGISTRQLHKLLTKYKLHKEEFKVRRYLTKTEA